MTALSVLDLVMMGEAQDLADAIAASRQLARHVEQHGYTRYWIAEHHDMPGIGSAATALIIRSHDGDTRGRGRHHAAQPFSVGGGRAVRHA